MPCTYITVFSQILAHTACAEPVGVSQSPLATVATAIACNCRDRDPCKRFGTRTQTGSHSRLQRRYVLLRQRLDPYTLAFFAIEMQQMLKPSPSTRLHGVGSLLQRPALSIRYRMKHCTRAAAAIELPKKFSKARFPFTTVEQMSTWQLQKATQKLCFVAGQSQGRPGFV